MAGGVDDRIATPRRSKWNLGRVDGDVLLLFLEQRVEQKGKFKFHPLGGTGLSYLLDFALRQGTSIVQDPPNQRGLAMIDVTDKNHAERPLHV